MKNLIVCVLLVLLPIMSFSGCTDTVEKSTNLAIIYGVATIVSLLLLIGCFLLVRQKRAWFMVLFSAVSVVNLGYTCLAVSSCLEMALMANRIAYLGSVFLPLSMLMILLNVTNTPYKKWLPSLLLGLAVVIFLIAASPGILPIYYQKVSFEVVGGVSTLVKTYGPLHPLYLVYLLGYFVGMVAVIIRASVKKRVDTTAHAVMLAGAVFVNIGVWLIEQFVSVGFEVLSVSYIISELFLLGAYRMMKETQQLRRLVKQVETAPTYPSGDSVGTEDRIEPISAANAVDPAQLEAFMTGIATLTPTERLIFEAYLARLTTKEILEKLNIKENTLKYHNRNIYGKLGVSSRKEIWELHKQIQSAKEILDKAESPSGL
ncbi:MAG: hypothetical protein E7618_03310 [Ruminococcaceae bacterium]|nr:hypothetical protein [Oscillospiraceae bacterium]